MRPSGDTTTCLAYKTRTRADLEQRGYTIVANIGNNRSDVGGGHAERAFKRRTAVLTLDQLKASPDWRWSTSPQA